MTDRKKGNIYVIGQFTIILFALISSILEPQLFDHSFNLTRTIIGAILAAGGIGCMIASVRSFKQEITAHPMPREDYALMKDGMYGMIRHPIYFSALLLVAGGVLLLQSYLSLIWLIVLFIWFDRKASFEEGFLVKKFSEYHTYRLSTNKIIPYIY